MTSYANAARPRRRALVVGAGVAGMATALRLHQTGWEPVLLEQAHGRRTGGYFLRFANPGYAAAERMGLIAALPRRIDSRGRMIDVDRHNRVQSDASVSQFERARSVVLLRGDIERVLFDAIDERVEVRYGTTVREIAQDAGGVDVGLSDGTTERYELLVGADGVHSSVRAMVFGPEERFRADLDHLAAAVVFEKPLGVELPGILMMTEPGRAAQVCKFIGHPPAAYFMYRARSPEVELRKKPVEALRGVFGDFKGPMPAMLDAFNESRSIYFDRVSQIHMDRWTDGRIVLVGDAAYCPNLYSGQGAGMGIFGAELLGTVLQNHPTDIPAALREWEARVRPEADRQQKAGMRMKHIFVPGNRPTYFARKLFMLTLQTPGLEAIVDRVLFSNN